MKKFTAKSHFYRLAAVAAIALVAFLVIKAWAVPSSWVDADGNWYRGASLDEMLEQPLIYGGNESCVECHKEQHDDVGQHAHKALSCESCHGSLADHAQEGKKIADAKVETTSSWQCLNCHDRRITKPKDFPQFDGVKIMEHTDMHNQMHNEKPKENEDVMLCTTCHNAHDPKP
ncbi:MAG: hypothetical protein A3G18_06955 [Rhodospirillales bacterium RIFCSPLOWO2_12_FULL_58_28]|nr:MAG: hypothetical protein A3H92_11520 [Rhodospirillales bacterium RIFCSPLOWO2_02_FULL_58_16]OHC77459.1 MAG: hypothetical protein A3G18_06955 [Rhodospirillales bacterium RIFCSPLOWO2_12_FULL_58_28]